MLMPKRIAVTDNQIEWLRTNHESATFEEIAAFLSCCQDTAKRILVRLGLQEFEGAKYMTPRDFDQPMWTRPCVCCRDVKPRPKGYYMCIPCRTKAGYTE
jgi:hypothetical protein